MGMTFNVIGAAILGSCGFKGGGEGFSVNFRKTSLIKGFWSQQAIFLLNYLGIGINLVQIVEQNKVFQ